MRALMLAAGRGRRMKGLTDDKPKALLKVGGKPLLQWAIENLRTAGIFELGIVNGYKAETVSWPEFQASFHNPQWETTQMVYSLNHAAEWLRSGTNIVCYSDILFTPQTIVKLAETPGDIVITNNVNWRQVWAKRFADPLLDAETFKRDSSGRLIEIGQKPKTMADIEGQYMGLLKFTPVGWAEMEKFFGTLTKEQFARVDMTSTLNKLIQRGVNIRAVDVSEDWFEFDSEEDLRSYQ